MSLLRPNAQGPLKPDRDWSRCGFNYDYGPAKQCVRDTTHFVRDFAAGGAMYFLCPAHARALCDVLDKKGRAYALGEMTRSISQLKSELGI